MRDDCRLRSLRRLTLRR